MVEKPVSRPSCNKNSVSAIKTQAKHAAFIHLWEKVSGLNILLYSWKGFSWFNFISLVCWQSLVLLTDAFNQETVRVAAKLCCACVLECCPRSFCCSCVLLPAIQQERRRHSIGSEARKEDDVGDAQRNSIIVVSHIGIRTS